MRLPDASLKYLISTSGQHLSIIGLKDSEVIMVEGDNNDRNATLDSIYWGRVEHISGKTAYVNIGLKRPGILEGATFQKGERVLVQVTREAFMDAGEIHQLLPYKGVRLTHKIMLAGRGCIYQPHKSGLNFSKQLLGESRELLTDHFADQQGILFRSYAAYLPISILQAQIITLQNLYHHLMTTFPSSKIGLIYLGPTPLERLLREILPQEIEKLIFDSPETFVQAKKICQQLNIDLAEKMDLFKPVKDSLFAVFNLEEIWDTCFLPYISLAGVVVTFLQTNCATFIDVNGPPALLEDINLQAAKIIGQQIHWRHLSGRIIIDFAAPSSRVKKEIIKILQNCLPAAVQIVGWSKLGWLELTSPRHRLSIGERYDSP